MSGPRLRRFRPSGPRTTGYSSLRGVPRNGPGMTGPRGSAARLRDVRRIVLRAAGPKMTGLRETADRAVDSRTGGTDRTDLQEMAVSRATAIRKDSPRITAAVTIAATGTARAETEAPVRAAREERTADSSSQEEAAARMADHRETDRMDFSEAAGRVLAAVWAIAVARALVREATAIGAVARATAEALEDRELDSEIINPRALQERLRARIWRRSARKKRGAPTARRKANVPERTISTKRMRR